MKKEQLEQATDTMLTIKDIQTHLHIGRDTAYSLVKLSTFPSIKIGRTYLIPLAEYRKWLSKSIGKEYYVR